MTNQQVADAFAQGETTGHSLNMFIEHDVVYSYGYHFPIAIKRENAVWFNTSGYSQTTACHKGKIRRALEAAGVKIIDVVTTQDMQDLIDSKTRFDNLHSAYKGRVITTT